MIYREIPIQAEGSGQDAHARFYIQETHPETMMIRKRPMIIICPGGGYERLSYREGEPLALHFLSQGYHACVLQYSTAPATFPTQILEVGLTVKEIWQHAEEWHVDTQKIVVSGASAGGHLAASYGIFWEQEFLADKLDIPTEQLKPRGILLSYPVITSDPQYAHMPSFQNLLGEKYTSCVQTMSLEHQITSHMPPCFIWHTATDQTVPLPNSLLLAMELWKSGVPVELRVYPQGVHGLSLASTLVQYQDGRGKQEECAGWIALADRWLENIFK